jgi:hypothetical protein
MAKPSVYRDKDENNLALKSVPHEVQLRREAQDMGRVGLWLGSRDNAAMYFAALIALIVSVFLGVLAVVDISIRGDIVKLFAGIAVAAMGFLGGKGHRTY